jgi:hypothetical protein
MNRKILLGIGVLAVLGAVSAIYLHATRPPPEAAPAPPPATVSTTPPPAAPPPIANPVPEAPNATPLPELDASDAPLGSELGALTGAAGLAELLRPENLVRHIVATVDNLPRARLDVEQRPLRRAAGEFMALGPDDAAVLNPRNAERYEPYVRIVAGLDMQQLAALYFRYYPLFQQAYRDLGNPGGYFNDRLVAVIDHLLATPDAPEPIRLVRPKIMYEFADPELQALSSGQKLLLRLGPAQRRTVLAQLRVLRSSVAHAPAR